MSDEKKDGALGFLWRFCVCALVGLGIYLGFKWLFA